MTKRRSCKDWLDKWMALDIVGSGVVGKHKDHSWVVHRRTVLVHGRWLYDLEKR